ncbi:DsrE family protein [Pseudodesulfovibrio sp.]|nr:DsrE family protein [Pseudodesulfovibrio sp.]
MKKRLTTCGLILLVSLFCTAAFAGMNKQVAANITTSDVNKAAMAIKFTHNIMKTKGMKATLFFNVYGVELVNKNKISPIYPTGQNISQMIAEFIKDGGTVLACPMCMKNVGGMTNADLLPGVTAQQGAGLEAITQPETLVLSY